MTMTEGFTDEEREAIGKAQTAIHNVVVTLEELAWKTYVREWDKNPFPKMNLLRKGKG